MARANRLTQDFTEVQNLINQIPDKAEKDTSAVEGNIAVFDSEGNPVDSGTGEAGFITDAEREKLAGIESGAEVNVQPDWSQGDSSADDYIKNRTHWIEGVEVEDAQLAWTGDTAATADFFIKDTSLHFVEIPPRQGGDKSWQLDARSGNYDSVIINYFSFLSALDVALFKEGLGVQFIATVGNFSFSRHYDIDLNIDLSIRAVHKLDNEYLDMDIIPTAASDKPVTSGGVRNAISALNGSNLEYTGNDGEYISSGESINSSLLLLDEAVDETNGRIDNLKGSQVVYDGEDGDSVIVHGDTVDQCLKGLDDQAAYVISNYQYKISDIDTIRAGAALGATAYQKPSTGIPKSALASAVKTSLEKADTALQPSDLNGYATEGYVDQEVYEQVSGVVKYTEQELTEAQQAQARTNIAAASDSEVSQLRSEMVNILGVGFRFMGVATPETNPGTPDQRVFYLAGPGTYPNFNALVVSVGGIAILKYNGAWSKEEIDMDGANLDLSEQIIMAGAITASNVWSSSIYNHANVQIAVKPGDIFKITANAVNPSYYAFLRTQSYWVPGESPDFSLLDSGRHGITAGQEICVTVPDDANFLYLVLSNNNVDQTPQSVRRIITPDMINAELGRIKSDIDILAGAFDNECNYDTDDFFSTSPEHAQVTKIDGNAYKIQVIDPIANQYILYRLPNTLVDGQDYNVTFEYESRLTNDWYLGIANESYQRVSTGLGYIPYTGSGQLSFNYVHGAENKYFRLALVNSSSRTGLIIRNLSISINKTTVAELSTEVLNLKERKIEKKEIIYDLSDTLIIDRRTSSSSFGQPIAATNANWGVTDYIDISNYSHIRFYNNELTTAHFYFDRAGTVFYDSVKNPLVDGIQGLKYGIYASFTWKDVLIPQGAKYVRITASMSLNGSTTYPIILYKLALDDIHNADLTGCLYRYFGDRITLRKRAYTYAMTYSNSVAGQSAANFGKYLFIVTNYFARVILYDLEKANIIYTWDTGVPQEASWHCNQSSFGTQKYDEADIFPVLYVSQRNNAEGRGVIQAYRIMPTLSDGEIVSFTMVMVQQIFLPIMTGTNCLGNPNFTIDAERGFAWVYSRNNDTSAANYLKARFTKFAIPSLENETVTLNDSDILDSFEDNWSMANVQGAVISDGQLYIGQGYPNVNYIYLRVVDLYARQKQVSLIDLYADGLGEEPEGVFIYSDELYLHTNGAKIFKLFFPQI